MRFRLRKEDILKYLLIAAFISVSFCFIIKVLGVTPVRPATQYQPPKMALPWVLAYSDMAGWWVHRGMTAGMPYIDQKVEYPVIIGMVMYLSSRHGQIYYFIFHYLLYLACVLISTVFLYRLSEMMKTKKMNLFLFWALAPTMLWFVYYNWDIIAVTFSISALYYYMQKKDILATVLLSLGFAAKMYPILFLFPVLLHREFKDWIKLGSVFVFTFLMANIYFIVNNFEFWSLIYTFHSTRPPNTDSIWALFMRLFPGITIKSLNTATLVIFAALYLYFNLTFRERDFIFLSYVSVLLFLLVNKVFSPQFLLWVLPFFALYGLEFLTFYSLELSNLAVLFTTLPHTFSNQEFTLYLVFSGIFVVIRHIILIYILLVLVGIIRKQKSFHQAHPD